MAQSNPFFITYSTSQRFRRVSARYRIMKIRETFSLHSSRPAEGRYLGRVINDKGSGIHVGQALPSIKETRDLQNGSDFGSFVSQHSSQISNSNDSSLSREFAASTPQSSSGSSEISQCVTQHDHSIQQNNPSPGAATSHDFEPYPRADGTSAQKLEQKRRQLPARHCTYEQLNYRQRISLFLTLALCGFLATTASIGRLDGLPVQEKESSNWHVGVTMVPLAGGICLLSLGCGALIWGPIGDLCGRRWPQIVAAFLFSVLNVAVACSPNYVLYIFFRCLVAVQGACFLIIGSSCVGEIYPDKELPSAIGWFFLSSFSGSCIGRPVLAAMIGKPPVNLTRAKWSAFFWFQAGLGLLVTVALYFLMPETVERKRYNHFLRLPPSAKLHVLWTVLNPSRVVGLYRLPNIFIVSFASGALIFDTYTITTETLIKMASGEGQKHVVPPASGIMWLMLFFPAAGAAVGILTADKWEDLNLWIYSRLCKDKEVQLSEPCSEQEAAEGIDEDYEPDVEVQTSAERRLVSSLIPLGLVLPFCTLLFGLSIEFKFGGDALRIVVAFIQGLAQSLCVPSLTTYTMEITRTRCAEALAANHLLRYLFACICNATTPYGFDRPGLAAYSGISSSLLALSAFLI